MSFNSPYSSVPFNSPYISVPTPRLRCGLGDKHDLPISYSSTSALLYQSCASFLASQLNRTWHILCRAMPGHCRKGVLMCTAGCIVPCWFGTDSSFGGGVGAGFSTGIPWSVSQGRMIVCQCSSWVMTVVFLCTSADK